MRSNAATIQAALENVNYPKRKEEILDYAKSHNLSEDIMSDLQEISDRIYKSPLDVRDEFEEGRHSSAARQSVRENEQSPKDGPDQGKPAFIRNTGFYVMCIIFFVHIKFKYLFI